MTDPAYLFDEDSFNLVFGDPVPEEAPCLSDVASMAAFLMEAGWVLHLPSDKEKQPTIWKARDSKHLHVDTCELSHDEVLELQQAGLLERCYEFGDGDGTVTAFRYAR